MTRLRMRLEWARADTATWMAEWHSAALVVTRTGVSARLPEVRRPDSTARGPVAATRLDAEGWAEQEAGAR